MNRAPTSSTARTRAAVKSEVLAARRAILQAQWAASGAQLTWEQAEAGVVCRGCGLEVVGDAKWRGHIPVDRKPEYARIKAAEAARFAAAHPDCSGNSISSTTSTVRHCVDCCPPMPTKNVTLDPDLRARLDTVRTGR